MWTTTISGALWNFSGDVWFNGWEQMSEALSVAQGERLSEKLVELGVSWNAAVRARSKKMGAPGLGSVFKGRDPTVTVADLPKP